VTVEGVGPASVRQRTDSAAPLADTHDQDTLALVSQFPPDYSC
jgi:hypothetical protein